MKAQRRRRLLAWSMLVVGLLGSAVTLPLWLLGDIDDRAMIGLTLVLSWAALWYAAVVALWTYE